MRCDTCADAGDDGSAESGITGDDAGDGVRAVIGVETGDESAQTGAAYL